MREGPACRSEVTDVHAHRPPYVHNRHERLMHVTEVCPARLDVFDVAKYVLAPPLRVPGHRVEAEIADGGRYVRAQDVDLTYRVQPRRHLLLAYLPRHVERRGQRAADE